MHYKAVLVLVILVSFAMGDNQVCSPGFGYDNALGSCIECQSGFYSRGEGKHVAKYFDTSCQKPECWQQVDGGRVLRSGDVLPSAFKYQYTLETMGYIVVDIRYMVDSDSVLSVEFDSKMPIHDYAVSSPQRRLIRLPPTGIMNSGDKILTITMDTFSSHVNHTNFAYLHGIEITGVSDICSPCPPGTYSNTKASACTPCSDGTAGPYFNQSGACSACMSGQITQYEGAISCINPPQCTAMDTARHLGPCNAVNMTQTVTVESSGWPSTPACTDGGVMPTPHSLPPQQCLSCRGSLVFDRGQCVPCTTGSYRRDGALFDTPCRNCSAGTATMRQLVFDKFDGEWESGWSHECSGRCRDGYPAWNRDGDALHTSRWHGSAYLIATLVVNQTMPTISFEYVSEGMLYFLIDGVVKATLSGAGSAEYSSESGEKVYQWVFDSDGNAGAELRNIVVIGTESGGAAKCINCESGEYSPSEAASSCKVCPAGTMSGMAAEFGQTSCTACPPNHFSRHEGSSKCLPCGRGTAGNKYYGSNDCEWGQCQFLLHGVSPRTLFDLAPLPSVKVVAAGLYWTLGVCHRMTCGNDMSLSCDSDGTSAGRMLDISIETVPKLHIIARMLYGDACYDSQRAQTEVSLQCSLESGVGTPTYIGMDSCTAKFQWNTQHACPVCTDKDIVYVKGDCIDGVRVETSVRLRPCYTSKPLPPLQRVPCIAPSTSWGVILGIGGAGAVLIGVIALLWVRNRRLYRKYRKVVNEGIE